MDVNFGLIPPTPLSNIIFICWYKLCCFLNFNFKYSLNKVQNLLLPIQIYEFVPEEFEHSLCTIKTTNIWENVNIFLHTSFTLESSTWNTEIPFNGAHKTYQVNFHFVKYICVSTAVYIVHRYEGITSLGWEGQFVIGSVEPPFTTFPRRRGSCQNFVCMYLSRIYMYVYVIGARLWNSLPQLIYRNLPVRSFGQSFKCSCMN